VVVTPEFTILLPVLRPPVFLPIAIDTVRAQEEQRFELFVICDGAPRETVAYAERMSAEDARIRVLARPKGERHGERWRHEALEQAQGRLIAHINDDDLWFPSHLAEMARLLEGADFGNLLHVNMGVDALETCFFQDLGDARIRARMLEEELNFFGPSAAGYRLAAYRSLPVGWSPAPPGLWTDLHMWRKFLRQPGLRFATRFVVTSLHYGTAMRGRAQGDLLAASHRWRARVADPARRAAITEEALRLGCAYHNARLRRLLESRTYRAGAVFARLWRLVS
jgi:glycosyltransferase involved in cell wall biosynthesis